MLDRQFVKEHIEALYDLIEAEIVPIIKSQLKNDCVTNKRYKAFAGIDDLDYKEILIDFFVSRAEEERLFYVTAQRIKELEHKNLIYLDHAKKFGAVSAVITAGVAALTGTGIWLGETLLAPVFAAFPAAIVGVAIAAISALIVALVFKIVQKFYERAVEKNEVEIKSLKAVACWKEAGFFSGIRLEKKSNAITIQRKEREQENEFQEVEISPTLSRQTLVSLQAQESSSSSSSSGSSSDDEKERVFSQR